MSKKTHESNPQAEPAIKEGSVVEAPKLPLPIVEVWLRGRVPEKATIDRRDFDPVKHAQSRAAASKPFVHQGEGIR